MWESCSVWLLLMVGCALFVTACTKPFAKPDLEPSDAVFPGLLESRRPGDPDHVDVISIHGMCTHGRDWVEETSKSLGKELGLTYGMPSAPAYVINSAEVWITDFSDSSGNVVVRDYAIVWSPLTVHEKAALCYDSNVKTGSCATPGYQHKRARINGLIKSTLLNDCLADAIVYLGSKGKEIRNTFRDILTRIGESRSEPAAPTFLITESLGSKILKDSVVADDLSSKARIPIDVLTATKQIFMAANQIPILELADHKKLKGVGIRAVDELRRAIEKRRSLSFELQDAEPIRLIAFSDPNDLLSYGLRDPNADTINITVSNTYTWFGQLENPLPAHRGYLANKKVWELIACGHDRKCNQ